MNITIRRTESSDAEALSRILSGPKVIWGTLQLPFPSTDQWRKRIAEPDPGLYSLVACVEHKVVGQLTLHTFPQSPRRKHIAQLGMSVRDDWQGRGVGTALMQAAVEMADKWLNILRIELDVFVDNEPAIRLYKKFEFEIEGTKKLFAFRDGEYIDTYFMARLRK